MKFLLSILGINFLKSLLHINIGWSFFKILSPKVVCNNFSYLIKLALLLLLLTSCSRYWYKPYGKIFNHKPSGSPGLELGWVHGCESGLGTQFGGAIMMTFYSWNKDETIAAYSGENINPNSPEIIEVRNKYGKDLDIDWNNPQEIAKNFNEYNMIFWRSHIFCRHSILQTLNSSEMTPPLPSEQRYEMDKHSPMDVWKFDRGNNFRITNW
jgi:hypothetical protein